uniref:type II toxin-antitoxin system RelE/ParE family toxin n=2 Tax=Gelidibacter sp. TaxID=2018083 RepID=UPI00404A6653
MEENFELSDEARLELHRAKCYFKLIDKEDDFLDDLTNQLRLIQNMPEAFQIRYKNVRIIHFEKFEYSIHYRLKTNGMITIYHIINQNQDF